MIPRTSFLAKLFKSDTQLQVFLFLFMLLFYGIVLFDAGVQHPSIGTIDLTLNSMLQHLVRGRFDVDANIVGGEGFARQGLVYSYWGIFCALLRAPLLLFHRMNVDITTWSCLAAVSFAGIMKVRTLLFVRSQCSRQSLDSVFALMLAYVIFGGSEIAYLQSSIFQEIVFWAAAFGAAFVYLAVKGIVGRRFTTSILTWMALVSGLALLTRVSTGIGLCTAFGLLLATLSLQERSPFVLSRRFLLPAAVLTALIAIALTVNYFRWGNPTTFADYALSLHQARYPDRLPRTRLYGLFNIRRIPFGLVYYFFPIWCLHSPNGHLFFEAAHNRLMDSVELPPSSFLLTDLLPCLLIGWLPSAWKLLSRPPSKVQIGALAAGLAIPIMFMLTAISMNYRYRMEFYPEMDLLAFLGLYAITCGEGHTKLRTRKLLLRGATVISIGFAFAVMVLYKLSEFGPSQQLLRKGIVRYYVDQADIDVHVVGPIQWMDANTAAQRSRS